MKILHGGKDARHRARLVATGSGERPNRPFRKLLDTLERPGSSEAKKSRPEAVNTLER